MSVVVLPDSAHECPDVTGTPPGLKQDLQGQAGWGVGGEGTQES